MYSASRAVSSPVGFEDSQKGWTLFGQACCIAARGAFSRGGRLPS